MNRGRALRDARWGLAVTLLGLALFVFLYADKHPQGAGSDGYYTWLYTRSLVFDQDLDFTNDYALCGDPQHKGADRGTGRPDNPFYVGPSVTWAPVLWLQKTLTPRPLSEPEAVRLACRGPLAVRTFLVGPLLGALTLWLVYRIGRRWLDDGPAALSAALLGAGTPLFAYASVTPTYSHVYDAFWAAAAVLAALRAAERAESPGRWALAGVLVGVDLLQRPVSVLYGVVPAALAVAYFGRSRRLVAPLAALGLGVLLCGVLPQLLVYKYLYGTYFVGAPPGRFFMQYGHAHPWLLLFAPHGGLFFGSPVVWLAVPGLGLGLADARTRTLSGAILVASAATIWVSSAALDWDASATYGARRLTSLVGLVAPAFAFIVARARRWLRARPSRSALALALAIAVPFAFNALGTVAGVGSFAIDPSHGRSQAELYGGGSRAAWGLVDRVCDLAILPAEVVFRLRYGLPMTSFRDATEPVYRVDYRTMTFEGTELDLTHGRHAAQVTGFTSGEDGMTLVERRGTLVFTAEWPYATEVVVMARAARDAALRLGIGRATGTDWVGTISLSTAAQRTALSLPAGTFDSGLDEIVFESSDPDARVVVSSLRFADRTSYGPPL